MTDMIKNIGIATVLLLFTFGCQKEEKINKNDLKLKNDINTINFNIEMNPETLNPHKVTIGYGQNVVYNVFEGLYTLNEEGEPTPGVAESVTVSNDNLVYTFKLKKNAKWSDGVSVCADDFVYSWKKALDPKTASPFFYYLFNIKNAEEYFSGKVSDEKLGVKALDKNTLEVTLEKPMLYFLTLLTNPIFFPLREDIVENEPKWSEIPEKYIGNGPFKLAEWLRREKIVLVKNENYWDNLKVKIEKLNLFMVIDEENFIKKFENGELDIIDSISYNLVNSLLKDGRAKKYQYYSMHYYGVNLSKEMQEKDNEVFNFLSDIRIRSALSLAIDRDYISKNILKNGENSLLKMIPNSNKKLEEAGELLSENAQIAKAKQLILEAGYKDIREMPTIKLTITSQEDEKKIAEAIKNMWYKNLGINTQIEVKEWEKFYASKINKNYEIIKFNWSVDYTDLISFYSMFETDSQNNYLGYSNQKYDQILKEVKITSDNNKRDDLLKNAELILMKEVPFIPLYNEVKIIASKPNVKGWYTTPMGGYFFKEAYKE